MTSRSLSMRTLGRLELAVERGDLAVMTTVLDEETDAELQLPGYTSPLNYALLLSCDAGNVAAVRFLIGRGADVNCEGTLRFQTTPLLIAAQRGRLEVMGILIEHKADVNKHVSHTTALTNALLHPDCVSLLLQAGASVHVPIALGKAILTRANQSVLLLLRGGADPNSSSYGMTALTAALTSNVACVKPLIDSGALYSSLDVMGRNALHCLARNGRDEWSDIRLVLELLVSLGVDINLRDSDGSTPIHTLLSYTPTPVFHECISSYLAMGADLEIRDAHGRTPFHCGCLLHDASKAAILLDLGANPTTPDLNGQTAQETAGLQMTELFRNLPKKEKL